MNTQQLSNGLLVSPLADCWRLMRASSVVTALSLCVDPRGHTPTPPLAAALDSCLAGLPDRSLSAVYHHVRNLP